MKIVITVDKKEDYRGEPNGYYSVGSYINFKNEKEFSDFVDSMDTSTQANYIAGVRDEADGAPYEFIEWFISNNSVYGMEAVKELKREIKEIYKEIKENMK